LLASANETQLLGEILRAEQTPLRVRTIPKKKIRVRTRIITEALESAPSVLILCVEERRYAEPEENFRGNFPKREVAGVPSTPGFGVMGWSASALR
jgi:hypothetical protein